MKTICDKCNVDMYYTGFGEFTCYTCGFKSKQTVYCKNCNKDIATQNWVGEGGTLAFAHGMYQEWCEICVTKEQLKYAKEQAERIPELEKKLEELITTGFNPEKVDVDILEKIEKIEKMK